MESTIHVLDLRATYMAANVKNSSSIKTESSIKAGKPENDFKSTFDNTSQNKITENEPKNDIKKDNVQTTEPKNEDTINEAEMKELNSVAKKDIKPVENVDDTEQPDNLQELQQRIMSMVAEALGISEQQLVQTLEQMGIEVQDLLQVDKLQSLILNITGNENMMQLLEKPMEEVAPIKDLLANMSELAKDTAVQDIIVKETVKTVPTEFQSAKQDNETVEQPMEQAVTDDGVVQDKLQTASAGDTAQGDADSEQSTNKQSSETTAGQTKETKSTLTGEQLVSNIDKALSRLGATRGNDNVQQSSQPQYVQIVQQIVDQINVIIRPGITTMQMQLTPENLGRLTMALSSDQNGVMKAVFTVDSQSVKEALETQMAQLKENFVQQGIKVESVEVKLSDYAFQQQQQAKQEKQKEKRQSKEQTEGIEAVEGEFSIESIIEELEAEIHGEDEEKEE